MSTLDFDAELVKAGATAQTRLARLRFLIWRNPLGAWGAAIMGLFVFVAVFADFLTGYDPLSTNAALSLAPPGGAHWLGTDPFGRDVYAPDHLRRADFAYGGDRGDDAGKRLRHHLRAHLRLP